MVLLANVYLFEVIAQTVTWQTWYDYENLDNIGYDVLQTNDGGYLFLGTNYPTVNASALLIKTNSLGFVEWKKKYGEEISGGERIMCFCLDINSKGQIVISGYTPDSGIIIKTDSIGDLVSIKKYSFPGIKNVQIYNHCSSIDGGIIACGVAYPPFGQGIIIKLDSSDNVEWYKLDNIFERVIQSKDSNYYFGQEYQILKIDKNGKELWRQSDASIGPVVLEDDDFKIYTGVYSGADSLVVHKLDSAGKKLWEKRYYPGAHGQAMCFSTDNNILLTGYKDTLLQGIIIVSKITLNGDIIFEKQIFSAIGSNLSFIPYAVKSTSDNGYVFTGFTNYPRFTSYMDNILAVKTDSTCSAPLITHINEVTTESLTDFILYQNYPNPFNPVTLIKYNLSKQTFVNLSIYNIRGQLIETLVNSRQSIGIHKEIFSGVSLPTGIYFYCLNSGNQRSVRKMILIK